MNKKINNSLKFSSVIAIAIALFFTSCDRDISDDATPSTYANTAEIFTDTPIGMGSDFYFPYSGSKATAWTVDSQVSYKGTSSMRFDVPNADDPNGSYAGGIFRVDGAGRDLTGYDALTFWIKASQGVVISELGFGEDFNTYSGNKYITTLNNTSIGTNWQKIIIPIPDASKLLQERGMFRYAAGTTGTNNLGYTFWIDELKFEKLGTIRVLESKILNGVDTTEQSFTGSVTTIGGLSSTFNLASGTNQTVSVAPSYYTFTSSNPAVATVNELGVVNVVGLTGTTVISAKLGSNLAKGSLTITSNGSFPQPPTPTHPAANVRSVFSNTYTNVVTPNFTPNFGGSTTTAILGSVSGNNFVRYSNNNYTGIMFLDSPINGSTMKFMHVDVYVQVASSVGFQIRDIGANQIIDTDVNSGNPIGDDKDYRFTANLTSGWNSINIPLAGNLTTQKNNLGAIIVTGGPNFILDNIYFFL